MLFREEGEEELQRRIEKRNNKHKGKTSEGERPFYDNKCRHRGMPGDRRSRSGRHGKVRKGARWMPRLLQAMKDVISCDKPREGANNR